LGSIGVAVKDYTREMVRHQQVYLKSVDLSVKPKPSALNLTPLSTALPLSAAPISTTNSKPSNLIPDRFRKIPFRSKIACVFGGVKSEPDIIIQQIPAPDVVCHKNALCDQNTVFDPGSYF
jgi:hypothetical protein